MLNPALPARVFAKPVCKACLQSLSAKSVCKGFLQRLSTNAARFEAASVKRNQQAEKYYKFICLCLFVSCQLAYTQRGVAGVKMLYTESLS